MQFNIIKYYHKLLEFSSIIYRKLNVPLLCVNFMLYYCKELLINQSRVHLLKSDLMHGVRHVQLKFLLCYSINNKGVITLVWKEMNV